MKWISADLFPTKITVVIFISYIVLFVNHGLLVTASKTRINTYSYNPTTVILVTEFLKLISAVVLYLKDNKGSGLFSDIVKHKQALLLYFVPAGLYCVYNNLAYVNLSTYDPATYFLLLQFRVVLTGIIFQILFKKKLSGMQWFSLILLTFGCILKEVHHSGITKIKPTTLYQSSSTSYQIFDIHFILILVQVFASVIAGVYNEYLLKGCDAHFMLQNIFMYFGSIVCNSSVLLYRGEFFSAFTHDHMKSIYLSPIVICIVINTTCIGICVSFFLRSLNSILKSFASAMELMFTAGLAWIIFGIAVDMYTFLSIVVVTCAILLYARNPVVNYPTTSSPQENKHHKINRNPEEV